MRGHDGIWFVHGDGVQECSLVTVVAFVKIPTGEHGLLSHFCVVLLSTYHPFGYNT